jgi:hypothetical protein
MTALIWFEENKDGEIDEHPPIDLKQALKLAAKAYAAAGTSCPVFGLMYGPDDWLEFFMDAPDSVGITCQATAATAEPKRKGFWGWLTSPGPKSAEKTLKSWGEVEANITAYYTDGPRFLFRADKRKA